MKRLSIFLTMVIVVLSTGCKDAPIVTSGELESLKTQWKEPKVSIWYYVGTKDSYHYFRHIDVDGTKTYRISNTEQKMEDPFPLTSDETSWRIMYWGFHAYMKTNEKEWEPNNRLQAIGAKARLQPEP